MKKFVVTVLVLGILGAGGYGVYHHFFENEGETERVSSDAENAVYVDLISNITGFGSGNGLIDRYGGKVEPQATLEVKLESDRKVEECFVKEGDEVQEGQRLFIYETQEDEDKIAQAEIDIEKAEGDIEVAQKAIKQYEKDKANATNSDDQLMATTNILSTQNEIKSKEYEIKTKKLEMERLRESIAGATVTADMAGIVQKISDSSGQDNYYGYGYGSGGDSAYITILAAGDYRIKGRINEQNMSQIDVGMPLIVHSRVDDSLTWNGTITEIKTDNTDEENNNNFYYSGMSSDSGSSSYAFYVELENSEGLILGQHVYLEPDLGQEEEKTGLWLEDYYIIQEDGKAYVWMANTSNVIEKHEITLGEYDEELMKYEVTEGLDAEDYIAYPMDTIQEGDPVIYNDYTSMGMGGMNLDGMDMGDMGLDGMDMGEMDLDGMDMGEMDLDGMDEMGEMSLDGMDMDGEMLSDPEADILDLDADSDSGEEMLDAFDADSDSGEEMLDAHDADSDSDEDMLDLDEEADFDSDEDAGQEN